MYIKRQLEERLLQALKQFPVVLISGPRQAGKSTLIRHTLKDYRYVTLDDPLIRALANEDPKLFISRYPQPLIIDEVQYAPELLTYLKMEVDQNRHQYGQYVLTGSQTFQLMKGVSESLAGRIAIFNLLPLDWNEIHGAPEHKNDAYDVRLMAQQTVQGFYPEFFSTPNLEKELWFGSYLNTYIERDVRNIKAISDLGRFQTFIRLLAGRAGQLLNIAEVSKECGISQPTAKDWITILESTYIIYILRPFHQNLTKRLVKSPKLYFVDTGLLCYLLGIDSEERFFKASERGHVFENMVIMDFIKNIQYRKERTNCFFYRTQHGVEVDLIADSSGGLDAYEIKLTKTPSREMEQGLIHFQKENSVRSAKLLCLVEESIPLSSTVTATHWSEF